MSKLRRQWSGLRARLRRQGAGLALLVLLVLGLGEPLLCIIHCQLWVPFAFQSYFASQHSHIHDAHHMHLASDATAVLAAPQLGAASGGMICMQGNGEDVPFHVPPSPVHDMAMAVILLVALITLIQANAPDTPGDPPDRSFPPPLRPPISWAA